MGGARWTWAAVALIAGAVGVFALYSFGWQSAREVTKPEDERDPAAADAETAAEREEAISLVRWRARQACEAFWWDSDVDPYCLGTVKATRFTAKELWDGVWLVHEHLRGDLPFQDSCWAVEPPKLEPADLPVGGWTVPGLSRAGCSPCPPRRSNRTARATGGRRLWIQVPGSRAGRC
jgi:hypothetical protein